MIEVGDMVRYAAGNCSSMGVVTAVLPGDRILACAVSVVWSSGELVERVPPRILEVVSASR